MKEGNSLRRMAHYPAVDMDSSALDQVMVRISDTRETTLSELLRAWRLHVERIRDEQGMEPGGGWTPYDLVAGLLLRDRISDSLGVQNQEIQAEAAGILSSADQIFSEISVEDTRGVVRGFAEDASSTPGWWCTRVPRTGPIRADLDDWDRRHESC